MMLYVFKCGYLNQKAEKILNMTGTALTRKNSTFKLILTNRKRNTFNLNNNSVCVHNDILYVYVQCS